MELEPLIRDLVRLKNAVENKDPKVPFSYFFRFVDAEGGSPVRCYFRDTTGDGGPRSQRLIEANRREFEALRQRYAGRDGIVYRELRPRPRA